MLVGFRYVFGKNYGWSLCAAKNMYKIFGSCVIAVAFQNAFHLNIH
jgi:TRAP-type C4-dicarboxylate transport system permease small subunit